MYHQKFHCEIVNTLDFIENNKTYTVKVEIFAVH